MSERTHDRLVLIKKPPVTRGLLWRKCACGQHGVDGEECAECSKKKLQRYPMNSTAPASVPHLVYEVLRSPGRALAPTVRAEHETNFGMDFSGVRVHTSPRAAESAMAVGALAYTVGRDIVFGAGQYAPDRPSGKHVLAHELAHVVQQVHATFPPKSLALAPLHDPAEREAATVASRVTAGRPSGSVLGRSEGRLRRTVKVEDPAVKIPKPGGKGVDQTNAETALSYLKTLCSPGGVTVDKSGAVSISGSFCTPTILPVFPIFGFPMITPSAAVLSKTPTGCTCLCDLVFSKHPWRIKIDDSAWPHTSFDDSNAANGKKPGGTGGVVTAPSPNSPKLWGAATSKGKALNIDSWLVLGHELCGHGWLGNSGQHGPDVASTRGEGGHQETVKRENLLRQEHGIDLRGTFKEPHCGESFWRLKKSPGKVNWSSYRAVCEAWRNAYNTRNKTSYKITDKIP